MTRKEKENLETWEVVIKKLVKLDQQKKILKKKNDIIDVAMARVNSNLGNIGPSRKIWKV